MYPVKNRLQWHMKGRHGHLAAAIDGHYQAKGTGSRRILQRRKTLGRAMTVRLVVLLLLSFGYIIVAAAWLAPYAPFLDVATGAVSTLASILSAFAGLLTIAFLLVSRWVSQLEMDLLTLLALGSRLRT